MEIFLCKKSMEANSQIKASIKSTLLSYNETEICVCNKLNNYDLNGIMRNNFT